MKVGGCVGDSLPRFLFGAAALFGSVAQLEGADVDVVTGGDGEGSGGG